MKVWLNGSVKEEMMIGQYSIYEVVNQKTSSKGWLELVITEPGVQIYTMTFGD